MTAPSEETTTCATCGSSVSKQEWHPAAVETTDEGDTIIRSFCSEECREQWTSMDKAATASTNDTAAD